MSDHVTSLNSVSSRRLILQIVVASLGRLLFNTARRFVYPFAPALSRGMDVSLTSVTSLIAINQFTGLLSPFFGPLSDRWGYRMMMMGGLVIFSMGMLAGGFFPIYGVIFLALFLAGLGKSIFDPAIQAYVGESVPYQRRGLVIGLMEFSWAGAALIGIPIIGLLIDRLGWRAPFLVQGGLGLIVAAVLGLLLPHGGQPTSPANSALKSIFIAWFRLSRERAAVGTLVFGFFFSMANDTLFVIYGAWLESSFALGLVALGTATTVIGVAELSGEALTAGFADRIGLKRGVMIRAVLTACSYLLLPVMTQQLSLALVGLFIVFITFEFTIVTNISFMTDVFPSGRATMMSSYVAVSGLGRVIGALTGGFVWLWGGLPAIGVLSAGVSGLALAAFIWGVRLQDA